MRKIRIILWDALIRSLITYALHTKTQAIRKYKMEKFAFKCMRRIDGEKWWKKEPKPDREQTYKKYNQPTIQTWIQKMSTTHVLNKPQKTGTYIHQNNKTLQS